ncbi:DUF2157 domain-containing protein [Ferrimonas balearica]|uniref:DUF2157 domain-containing protein n=1 Tax=Ferrimonas balearica TaxID=44012 RepID=UPI001C985E0E|nr:DUF2157 domain-containing protein [Ferrimonas balearica]MBY6105688.1 DUF2157 domain-containing protein [Ferrimonas balearica]MBY6223771.1 DUF2157 domain-containing protein [Ferrimonas balearica]
MSSDPLSPQLKAGVDAGIITPQQAQALQTLWQAAPGQAPARFDLTHLLYYLGALMAIGAMTVFLELSWDHFGGFGILALTGLYALAGLALQRRFERQQLMLPAGLSLVFVVCLTPLALYGFLLGMGWWPDKPSFPGLFRSLSGHYLLLELATILTATLALYWRRVPFLLMPFSVAVWFLSMDITQLWAAERLSWEARGQISMLAGAVLVALALYVDGRQHRLTPPGDYAFWLYLFGVLAFWLGLSSQESNSELSRAVYGAINLAMMFAGVLLNRRVFTLFGALGFCGYLGHLAYDLFRDSWWFPLVLTLLGLAVVLLGVRWQRQGQQWRRSLLARLPERWRRFPPFN